RGQRQIPARALVPRFTWYRVDYFNVRGHGFVRAFVDPIREPGCAVGEDDGVTGPQPGEVLEGVAVGAPVAGDREVALLAELGRARVVAEPLLQGVHGRVLEDGLVPCETEPRDVHDGERPTGDVRRRFPRARRAAGG